MSSRFEDHTALVTGGARGIGRAVAERLAAEGAHVLVADRDDAEAKRTAQACCQAGGSADALTLDVAEPASFGALAADLGPLDIVVANAGIQRFAAADTLSPETWDEVVDVNARGVLLTLQLASRDVVDGGAVVTVASVQAHLGNPISADYAASKAAVLSLTRTFATSLAPRGVRVNAVAPGRIQTDLSDYASTEVARLTGREADATLQDRIATNPLGRTGTPAEVAAAVAFLASVEASYITGECLNVCGGDVMMP